MSYHSRARRSRSIRGVAIGKEARGIGDYVVFIMVSNKLVNGVAVDT